MKQLLVAAPVLVLLVIGCGPSVNPNAPATVKGKVTYNNNPVTGGTLIFHKDGGYPVVIDPDGTYRGSSLPIGEATVTVNTESLNVKPQAYGGKKVESSPVPEGANTGPQGQYVKIPAKYSDPKTSPLKVTIVRGEQEHNIELTD
jgi:hypothetical protein